VVEKKGKGEEDPENPPTPGEPNYLAAERATRWSASDYKVSNAQGFKVWRKLKMVRKVTAGHQDGERI